jgi:hypothetical protein
VIANLVVTVSAVQPAPATVATVARAQKALIAPRVSVVLETAERKETVARKVVVREINQTSLSQPNIEIAFSLN